MHIDEKHTKGFWNKFIIWLTILLWAMLFLGRKSSWSLASSLSFWPSNENLGTRPASQWAMALPRDANPRPQHPYLSWLGMGILRRKGNNQTGWRAFRQVWQDRYRRLDLIWKWKLIQQIWLFHYAITRGGISNSLQGPKGSTLPYFVCMVFLL